MIRTPGILLCALGLIGCASESRVVISNDLSGLPPINLPTSLMGVSDDTAASCLAENLPPQVRTWTIVGWSRGVDQAGQAGAERGARLGCQLGWDAYSESPSAADG